MLVAALLASGGSIAGQDALPAMFDSAGFTPVARAFNNAGGVGFLGGAVWFVLAVRRRHHPGDVLFAVMCVLLGAAGILFGSSRLWDAQWWWWHALRLGAYLVAVVYVGGDYRSAQEEVIGLAVRLQDANRELEARVAERTAELEGINERLRAEMAERERLEAQRWQARLQHAQKLESLGVLAGGIAHDFNNLLVGILGNATLAASRLPPDHPIQVHLARIEHTARRTAELTRQMLAYSGKGRFVVEAVDLSAAVTDVLDLVSASISKKAQLQTALASGLPPVDADVAQLQQVLMNLVTNASDALGDGSGTIRVVTGQQTVMRPYLESMDVGVDVPEGDYVFVEVTDTGAGMDEATRHRMFDPFFTTKATGRGLGLAATMGIVRGHGGAIRVYSEVGVGTAIKVLFPIAGVPAARDEALPREVAPAPRGAGCVLVVDDEDVVREFARDVLEGAGFRVVVARDGPECLERLDEPREVDLVVLDLMMPGLGGDEVLARIRARNPGLPVLPSSGYNEQETARRFASADSSGGAAFIQKPYGASELLGWVARLLKPVGAKDAART